MDRFSRERAARLVRVSPGRLRYWEALGLARASQGDYPLSELSRLRKIARLYHAGLPAARLARLSPGWLDERWLDVLAGQVLVRDPEGLWLLESGQGVLDFDQTAADSAPTPHPRRLARARSLQAQGQLQEAVSELLRALPDESGWEGFWLHGTWSLSLGRPEEACQSLSEARRRGGETVPEVAFNLAIALEELGRLEPAEEVLRELLNNHPGFADAHFNRARILEMLGRSRAARRHWKAYLRLTPQGPGAQQVRRHLERTRGDIGLSLAGPG